MELHTVQEVFIYLEEINYDVNIIKCSMWHIFDNNSR
jgi:hypothetical protein